MAAHGANAGLRSRSRRRSAEAGRRARHEGGVGAAPLRGGASAFGPQLRAALLARGLRHRPGPRHRDRHRAAAADGRRARPPAASTAIASASRGTRRRSLTAAGASPPSRRRSGARARKRCWASTRTGPRPIRRRSRRCCARSTARRSGAGMPETTRNSPALLVRPGLCRPAGRTGCCRRFQGEIARRRGRNRVVRRGLLRARGQGGDLPVEEPCAVVLYADGALGPGRGTTPANATIARDTYRPDLYRAALQPLGVALPGANAKVEGALAGRHAGRLGRRKPDARPGRIFRRQRCSIRTNSTAISRARRRLMVLIRTARFVCTAQNVRRWIAE